MAQITKERLGEWFKTAISIIDENGGQLSSKDLVDEMRRRLTFTDYENAILEKTGNIRWTSAFHFWSIDFTKGGYIRKSKGTWYLTDSGKELLDLSPVKIIETANAAYKKWNEERLKTLDRSSIEGIQKIDTEGAIEKYQQANFEQVQESARKNISEFINQTDPYTFQDMVAALLKAMGYYIGFVAPRGKDQGVDVIAYKDPLGTISPRIKVQVKHREETKTSPQEIQQLSGILGDEDVGLFVSSGGFTNDAMRAIRNSRRHMEKIDLNGFIDLWEQYYDKLSEEDKSLLPLRKVAFLAPPEE